jgi:hypothetical protein
VIPFGCGLSLTGLTGCGSIPLDIACLGGLSLLGLSALEYLNEMPSRHEEKEVPMKKEKTGKAGSTVWFRMKRSLGSTVWAIGTGMWSASTLSG